MNITDIQTIFPTWTPTQVLWFFAIICIIWKIILFGFSVYKERQKWEMAVNAFFDDVVYNTHNFKLNKPHHEPCLVVAVFLGTNKIELMKKFNEDGSYNYKKYEFLLETIKSAKYRKFYIELCETYDIKNRIAFQNWLKKKDIKVHEEKRKQAKKHNKERDIYDGWKLCNEFDYSQYICSESEK